MALALPTMPCCQPASEGLLGKTSPSLALQVTERQTLTEPLQQRSGNPGDEQPHSEVSP